MKQLIIARKDLNMSPGKLAAQVSHASMAFLTNGLRANYKKVLNCERGRAWEIRPISSNNIEEHIALIKQQNELVKKNNPNSDYTKEIIQIGDKWYLKSPQWYRRGELHQWAKEARKRGEEYFYYRPINPTNPYGELELCAPTYHYEATTSFDVDVWEQWIEGSFTKVICEAKNKYQLEKIIPIAL